MRCASCDSIAIIDEPPRCKEHFIEGFEERVRRTIDEHALIHEGERIVVAASGGKDSLTLLVLLKRWFEDVSALAIDEGIAGYRDGTLADLRRVCDEHAIPLVIKSYEELAGKPLDRILAEGDFSPCAVCGTLRRHLLEQGAQGFDVLATGHNADDEAQAILMNLLKGNTELFARIGPSSGAGAQGFTRRVKPLYFCTEKEVMTYAFLHGLAGKFCECPNANIGYRFLIRDALNEHEESHHGTKRRLLERFLEARGALASPEPITLGACVSCGAPCSGTQCKACQFLVTIRNAD